MKIYPIYEFPNSLKTLKEILNYIDKYQPVLKEDLEYFVGKLIGKRMSRTKITIKDLRKLGIIEGTQKVSLTWEAQLYIDLSASLSKLLLYCIYRIPELFDICNFICTIDPKLELSKPMLFELLKKEGYEEGNLRTASEKLFAITRLIKTCVIGSENNPFIEYENYIKFLVSLEKNYLELSNNMYDKNIILWDLKDSFIDFSKKEFQNYLELLYKDAVFASRTSFSTVNQDFAIRPYIYVGDKKYYYLKIKSSFDF